MEIRPTPSAAALDAPIERAPQVEGIEAKPRLQEAEPAAESVLVVLHRTGPRGRRVIGVALR